MGAIQPANEIKLVSVPDMGYLVTDEPPRGEILVSGNNVSQVEFLESQLSVQLSYVDRRWR